MYILRYNKNQAPTSIRITLDQLTFGFGFWALNIMQVNHKNDYKDHIWKWGNQTARQNDTANKTNNNNNNLTAKDLPHSTPQNNMNRLTD